MRIVGVSVSGAEIKAVIDNPDDEKDEAVRERQPGSVAQV